MNRAARIGWALVIAGVFALAGLTDIRAADLIGGTLAATPSAVTLTSQATIPVDVRMHVDGPFTVTPDRFAMVPGQMVTMAVSGDPHGRVSATMTALTAMAGTDASSLTLNVGLQATPAPAELPGWPFLAVVALTAVLAALWRLKPWQYRLTARRIT